LTAAAERLGDERKAQGRNTEVCTRYSPTPFIFLTACCTLCDQSTMIRDCRDVFASVAPQRQIFNESADAADVGPGSYDPILPRPWLVEPMRQGSQFASKSQRSMRKGEQPLGSDVGYPPASTTEMKYLPQAPGSSGISWQCGERKPPFFHVPSRAYPLASGAPRGRAQGLDRMYELDGITASPVGLNGALAANVMRSPRKYKNLRADHRPVRPRSADPGSAGHLGPGSYSLERQGVRLRDPNRASSSFSRSTNGKYERVGGSYAEWLGIDLRKSEDPGAGSRERRRGECPRVLAESS